eukprot:scaffold4779_cov116-Isochrysis_galbana.AAC.15
MSHPRPPGMSAGRAQCAVVGALPLVEGSAAAATAAPPPIPPSSPLRRRAWSTPVQRASPEAVAQWHRDTFARVGRAASRSHGTDVSQRIGHTRIAAEMSGELDREPLATPPERGSTALDSNCGAG